MTDQKQTLIAAATEIVRRAARACMRDEPESVQNYAQLFCEETDKITLYILHLPDNHIVFGWPVDYATHWILDKVEYAGK